MPNTRCLFSGLSIEFDNQTLFPPLSATLNNHVAGLVGRNGRGKSVLLKLLAGRLAPTSGIIKWFSPFYYVAQTQRLDGVRIADALGIAPIYECFERIERGDGSLDDIEQVADFWHLPQSWRSLLDAANLNVSLADRIDTLSGGQQTRLALCTAFLHTGHYLLLDEPTNHLDQQGKEWLFERLSAHSAGALIASHDRALLQRVNHIYEIGQNGLIEYGGGYALYESEKSTKVSATERKIDAMAKQLCKDKLNQQNTLEKAAQRRKQGEKLRKRGSQCKVLLDKQKESAQQNLSKLKQQHQKIEHISSELQQNKQLLEQIDPQRLMLTTHGLRGGLRLYLQDLVLPWVKQPPITISLHSGDRLHIRGENGSGKSTLLKVINGLVAPVSGLCQVNGSALYLDQHFSALDKTCSAIDMLNRLHPDISLTDWRTRLASLHLRGNKALLPIGSLSGGEQLKVALLAVTGGNSAPDLLLLDEPDNHLDLDSRQLLEQALSVYQGTIIVISHDSEFVSHLAINKEIILSAL